MERTKRMPAGCTATGVLKLIALVFMFIDHSGKMVFGNAVWMRTLGRIAFPIYGWCLVVGACHTRSFPKYILRLLVLYAVSQPLYMVALNHSWNEPNIFLLLAIAVAGLWGMKEKRYGSQVWAPVLALLLAQVLNCDYGWRGVLFIFLLWAVRDSRPGIAAVMIAFCLYWGNSSTTLSTLCGLDLTWMKDTFLSSFYSGIFKMQAMAMLALPFLLLPDTESLRSVRLPRWAGYAFYPAHLVLLMLMEGVMLSGGFAAVGDRFSGLVLQPVLRLFGM